MRWVPILLVLASAVPGCTEGTAPTTPIEARAFVAEVEWRTHRLSLTLDGPWPYLAADGTELLGYRLQTLPLEEGDQWLATTEWFDADLRLVRRDVHCGWAGGADCSVELRSWIDLQEPPHFWRPYSGNLSGPHGIGWADLQGTVYVRDGAMLPVGEPDDLGRSFRRLSYAEGDVLAGADKTPVLPPTEGPWPNPMFPGADTDFLRLGFTPLEALDALKLQRPDVAVSLATGGCVTGFKARTPDLVGSTLPGEASVFIAVTKDDTSRLYQFTAVRAGPSRVFTPVGEREVQRPGTASCSELQQSPWPPLDATGMMERACRIPTHAERLLDFSTGILGSPPGAPFAFVCQSAHGTATFDANRGFGIMMQRAA